MVTKKTTKRKSLKRAFARKNYTISRSSGPTIENILIENFVSLQKVMANLSVKFDDLTNQITRLLQLFEVSAKAVAEKDFDVEKNNKDNLKILQKIESVLEQNRTIARGLSLMHDRIAEPSGYYSQSPGQRIITPQPPQQKPQLKPIQKASVMEGGVPEEYHRPISPNEQ